MSTETLEFAAWLALRESADAAARSTDLVEQVRHRLGETGPVVVHDLGTGTGSMGRWLATRLPGPQHWVMYDRDPELLAKARAGMAVQAADGRPVSVQTRQCDITRLTADDFDGASLITGSALLDMLTAEELDRIVAACADAAVPTLFTTSVLGRVEFTPADPLDNEVAEAFNAHQRRTVDGRSLLGPDAVEACVAAFRRRGVPAVVRSSPWLLGPDQAALISEWFTGWWDAAVEQRPELADRDAGYPDRRRAEAATGALEVVLHHRDILAGG